MIEFIGKFHPLVVHLPIGFLVLLVVFEIASLRWRHLDLRAATHLTLLITAPATLATALCGWLLAARGDYAGSTLDWHRWLGTVLGGATVILLAVHWRASAKVYRAALAATMLLLVAAGHFGGSLTHGSDFLSWPGGKSPAKSSPPVDLASQPVYTAVIQPILDKYCVSCHGPDKAKGGLRMDSAADLVKGGDSGSVLSPPSAALSLLGKRLTLPLEDDDHMPPESKPQLTKEQLAVLHWWLDAGAATDKTLTELNPAPEIKTLLQNLTAHASQ